MHTQTQEREPKDKDKESEEKTQRAAPQGSTETKATEESNRVSKQLPKEIKNSSSLHFLIFFLQQGSFLGLGYSYDFDVQQQLRELFDGNFLTVSQSGLDASNHFVSLLLNPENKRNKGNFERFVSRVTELKKPISFIAVDFATSDIKHLCDFLDKAISKLIEMGSVQNNVKFCLPLSCEGKLKMLTSKHFEVKFTVDDHVIKDVLFKNNINLTIETQYLYVDYSMNNSKMETITTLKRTTSRQGIYTL